MRRGTCEGTLTLTTRSRGAEASRYRVEFRIHTYVHCKRVAFAIEWTSWREQTWCQNVVPVGLKLVEPGARVASTEEAPAEGEVGWLDWYWSMCTSTYSTRGGQAQGPQISESSNVHGRGLRLGARASKVAAVLLYAVERSQPTAPARGLPA